MWHKPFKARLHWLLPDWEWKIEDQEQGVEIDLKSPQGVVSIRIFTSGPFSKLASQFSIARAGEILFGSSDANPIRGWTSPTYGVKIPALSLALELQGETQIHFSTEFKFPAP
jgi:hypothetical protein